MQNSRIIVETRWSVYLNCSRKSDVDTAVNLMASFTLQNKNKEHLQDHQLEI
jgi:hypothetical protein